MQGLEQRAFGDPAGPVRARHPQHHVRHGQVDRETGFRQGRHRRRMRTRSVSERDRDEGADRLLAIAEAGWFHDRPNRPDEAARQAAMLRPWNRITGQRRDDGYLYARCGAVSASILMDFHRNWCPRPD